MVTINRNCTKEELYRLQGYAKTIAPSLRFLYTQFYKGSNNYRVSFEVLVEEYNAINDCEEKIKIQKEAEEKRIKKEYWRSLNIFQKIKIKTLDFLKKLCYN